MVCQSVQSQELQNRGFKIKALLIKVKFTESNIGACKLVPY